MTAPSHTLRVENVPAVLAEAHKQLPQKPIEVTRGELELIRFEVAIAVNLDAPYRYAQDILWLEVVAPDDKSASLAASDWVRQAPTNFETTGMLRHAGTHENSLGFDHQHKPLQIYWNSPVLHNTAAATVIRHSISGIRIGFVAAPRAEERWLPAEAKGRFRLLTRKPTSSSDPAGLAPLVWSVRNPLPF